MLLRVLCVSAVASFPTAPFHFCYRQTRLPTVIEGLDILPLQYISEDNALGRLSDQQFVTLTSGFEEERAALVQKTAALEQQLSAAQSRKVNASRFLKLVRGYTDVRELTYDNLHEFIDRINIHNLNKETNTRKIEILYSFVGPIQGGERVSTTYLNKSLFSIF